ncbi:MAG: hypothetical protein FWD69_18880 [Polyangiaceae bacterium]|nr:hypothetical protein [Polyangiaceae bacterium]
MQLRVAILILNIWLLALLACKKEVAEHEEPVAADFGPPIAARVEASRDVPRFEIALAVSKNRDPESMLAPLVSVLSRSVRACPDLVAGGASGHITALSFEDGKAKLAGDMNPGASCLLSALEHESFSGVLPQGVVARMELRFAEDAGLTSLAPP